MKYVVFRQNADFFKGLELISFNCLNFHISDGVYSTDDPYTYVGCHKDDRDKRDLPNNFRRGNPGNPMTRDTCNDHCHGYLFFGLQVNCISRLYNKIWNKIRYHKIVYLGLLK